GKKATVNGKGYYYEPTVIADCKHDMRIMKEEIFGPVLPITTFKTLDEAIELANDCDYGLTSSIYTTDYDTVMRAMNEIKFGETYVNREHFEAFQGFHQGVRHSGIGGEDGERGLEEYLETHICYIDWDLKRNKA
ncbi:MAG: aldehyde dehydrogenase family protein, partial [Eggerthellaceae bacterium]|nr:aldehyde dehydrogenase family protein [Eggerthellaceae bacterium]